MKKKALILTALAATTLLLITGCQYQVNESGKTIVKSHQKENKKAK